MDSSNHNQKLQPQAPDAFAVLLSGSQSQSAAKRRKSGDQQAAGKYINCPVCQTSIPKSFIETHTEDCLLRANSSSQKHQQQRTDQCPNPSGHAAATSAGAAASPSSNKQQLLLGSPTKPASGAAAARSPSKSPRATQLYRSPRQRLPPDEFKAVVSAGWDRALKYVPGACEGGGGPPPLPAQLQILAQQQQSVTQQMQQQPQQQQPSAMSAGAQAAGSCAGNSSGPPAPAEPPAPAVAAGAAAGAGAVSTPGAAPAAMDAFAVLRSAQAAQVPMEAQLYLEGRQDGSWVCHWRLAGAASGGKDGTAAQVEGAGFFLAAPEWDGLQLLWRDQAVLQVTAARLHMCVEGQLACSGSTRRFACSREGCTSCVLSLSFSCC